MNQSEFEAGLLREGYQVVYSGFPPNQNNPEHTHEWDARLMVIGGEMTITRDGKTETLRPGVSCAVPANYPHTEQAGPQGVAYVVGRRAV